ncbi:MAG: Trk system potassium transporter TrkA [Clostridia bacterium]|nr:Trk system potassium transporter TrkA [Clostridia bacterium]
MKIVIIGDGKIGNTISCLLLKEGHDIVVVDKNLNTLETTQGLQDIMCVEGNGALYDVQMEAGVDTADLLIACTASDEMNMLACLLAKKIGAKATIARVRDPQYYQQLRYIKEDLGLGMAMNPEYATAQEIARVLTFPAATRIDLFAKGRIELVEFKLAENSVLDGLSLAEVYRRYKIRVLVCAVQRDKKVYIPDGSFVLRNGDKIHISASHKDIAEFFKTIHGLRDKVRSVIIVGGGRIAYYLAVRLIKQNTNVKIIDNDYARCVELSERLPKATVIYGDGTDQSLLLEEGLLNVDGFAALTGIDEENIIMSIYAKNNNVSKVIPKVNRSSYMEMIEQLGLECMVSPKIVAANNVVSYVRAMQNSMGSNVETLYRLVDGQVEAMEFLVREDAPYLGIPLCKLSIRKGILIAGIVRNRQQIVPDGETVIEKGDSVILATTNLRLRDLGEIFTDGKR